jgi:hypothetical protein
MTAQPITVDDDAQVEFAGTTVSGQILYFADQNALMLEDANTGSRDRLTVNLEAYGLTPKPGHVFIKDWSEGKGVADSLADAGLVELTTAYAVGPFASVAYEARVVI